MVTRARAGVVPVLFAACMFAMRCAAGPPTTAAMLLSPSGRGVLAPPGRPSLRYYEHVFYSLLQHGMTTNGTPRSVVDVGSSAPPFLEHIEFLPDRTILAPFFRDYNSFNGYNSTEEQTYAAPLGIEQITEDFAEWIPTKRWGMSMADLGSALPRLM